MEHIVFNAKMHPIVANGMAYGVYHDQVLNIISHVTRNASDTDSLY